MQVSPALKETRLPRAIQEQSDRLREKYAGAVALDGEVDPDADRTPSLPNPAESEPKPPSAARSPEDDSDPVYWKNRFHATEGMLRRERLDRKEEVKKFNQQLTEMQAEIIDLRNSTNAPSGDVSDDELGEWFTPEETEALGETEARAKVRTIKKAVKTQLSAAIKAEVKPLHDRSAQDAADALADRRTAFIDKLTELVPTWQEFDADENFLAWCAERNDDGIVRQEVIDKHTSEFNAAGVARMLSSYIKTKEVPKPPITPNGSGALPASAPPKNPKALTPPTQAEVKEFYKRAKLGKVKQAERAEFDARMKLRTGG